MAAGWKADMNYNTFLACIIHVVLMDNYFQDDS